MKLSLKAYLAVILLANLLGVFARAQVWTATNRWDGNAPIDIHNNTLSPNSKFRYTWRDKFADWLQDEADTNIFASGRAYFKGQADCKQAVYLLALEFAARNNLPFEANGITNNNTKFNGYSKDERIRRFAEFVQRNVSIRSLERDTYPITIDPVAVQPGAVLIFAKGEGMNHSLTVKSVDPLGRIGFIYGTNEEDIKRKAPTNSLFTAFGIEADGYPYDPPNDGFREFKFMNSSQSHYGTDQFTDGFKFYADGPNKESRDHSWAQAVMHHLAQFDIQPIEYVDYLLNALCTRTYNRAKVVIKGEIIKQKTQSFMSQSQYDGYYTVSRDENIHHLFSALESYIESQRMSRYYQNYVDEKFVQFSNCAVDFGISNDINQIITLDRLEDNLNKNLVSKNPNDSLECKWGMESNSSSCPGLSQSY